MDIVNRSLKQIADLFRTMTPAARITAGLLLAVIVISVTYLFRYQSGGAGELLLGGKEFSQPDIAAMEAAFAKAGLGGSVVEGNRLRIPIGQKAAYLAALEENEALPENFDGIFDEALNNEGWQTTDKLRRERIKRGLERQISHVISRLPGVESAHVTYAEDTLPGLSQKVERRAAAAVKLVGQRHLTDKDVQTIRAQVAGMVGGLDRKNVTVTCLNSGIAHTAIDDDGMSSASEDAYASRKMMYEELYREKILRGLSYIPGVLAEVNVTLDREVDSQEQTLKYDKDGFMYDTEEETQTRTANVEQRGGQPGAEPNGVGPNTAAEIASTETDKTNEEQNKSRTRGITGGQLITKRIAPYTPQLVAATVKIPNRYFEDLWRKRNPAPAGQPPAEADPNAVRTIRDDTIRKIEEEVVVLLPPKPPGEDRYKPVTVTFFDDLPLPAEAPPSVVAGATAWLGEWWPTIGVLALGLVSLLMLRGLLKSSDPAPAAAAAALAANEPANAAAAQDSSATAEGEAPPENSRRRRFKAAGPNLRDELALMVRENPDAAANVLRSWIGEAA